MAYDILLNLGVLTILPMLKERLLDPQDRLQVDAAYTSAKFLNNYIRSCIVKNTKIDY